MPRNQLVANPPENELYPQTVRQRVDLWGLCPGKWDQKPPRGIMEALAVTASFAQEMADSSQKSGRASSGEPVPQIWTSG